MQLRRKIYSTVGEVLVPVEKTTLSGEKSVKEMVSSIGEGLKKLAKNAGEGVKKVAAFPGEGVKKAAHEGIYRIPADDAVSKNFIEKMLKGIQKGEKSALQWAANNPNLMAAILASTAVAGTTAVVKAVKNRNKKKAAEEKVYSVLLTEDELRLFSELQKEFGFKERAAKYLRQLAQTPEVQGLAHSAKDTIGGLGRGTSKVVADFYGRAPEVAGDASTVIGRVTGDLQTAVNRGSEKARTGLHKFAKNIAKTAQRGQEQVAKMSNEEIFNAMMKIR